MSAHRQQAPVHLDRIPRTAKLSFFSGFLSDFQPLTVNSRVTPLVVALPYVSLASPLSSAFTHFDRGGRFRFISRQSPAYQPWWAPATLHILLCFHNHPYPSSATAAFSQSSALPGRVYCLRFSPVTSRQSPVTSVAVFCSFLQSGTPSFRFFSAAYRHFSAKEGVPLLATVEVKNKRRREVSRRREN